MALVESIDAYYISTMVQLSNETFTASPGDLVLPLAIEYLIYSESSKCYLNGVAASSPYEFFELVIRETRGLGRNLESETFRDTCFWRSE
jgi:hypothetical protein